MAIDPTTTTTVKVSELASAGYNTTDLIPHEVAGILKKGNLQDLATFIGGIISTEGAVGFRAVQVNDGETLPATDEQEFILVGPGTYPNVGGGPTITTTEPLNALVSNATYWFIGVEIPITATGVWGTITGVLSDQTDLNDVLDAKADLVDGKVPNSQLPSYVDDVVEVANYAALPATGETGKIYVTIDTGNVYRWSGSAYIRIADESPVWGIITGTLSDQTDLQDALDGKFDVPTGDTTQYIAGDGSLITFPVAGQAGTLVRLVRNISGATITKGSVVYINGASGNNPTIAKAIASGDSTSAQTFGLVQADITNNSNGYVVVTGDLIGVNTSAITEGSQLYLSSTTAGAYTTTKQLAPAHLVYIGVVTRSHASLGQIEVKIQNGYELDELHDVAISSKANNEVIVYESSTDLWKNKSIATILGYTPANDASVVKLTGDQSIAGNKTFTTEVRTIFQNGDAAQITFKNTGDLTKTLNIGHGSNGNIFSSTGLDFRVGGLTSSALLILANENATFKENLTAKSFIKSGGTSSQFLKADGSVDSTTYQTALTNPVTGTGTTGYVAFWNGTSSITGESNLFWDSTNDRLGVGIVPETKTHFLGTGVTTTAANTKTTATTRIDVNSAGGSVGIGQNSLNQVLIQAYNYLSNTAEAITLNAYGGRVGVGTQSPQERFVVSNLGGAGIEFNPDFSTNTALIRSYNRSTTAYSSFIIDSLDFNFYTSGNPKMTLTSGGLVGIGTTSPSGKLEVSGGYAQFNGGGIDATLGEAILFGNTTYPTAQKNRIRSSISATGANNLLVFETGTATAGTYNNNQLVLRGDGNVGIGTTSPSTKLDVVGAITASGGFFNSDIRLKNLIDYDYNVSDIKAISYFWKDGRDNKKHVGYSAQEVQKVMPDAVNEGTDGMLSVNYVEVLVAKIAELENRIKQLEK